MRAVERPVEALSLRSGTFPLMVLRVQKLDPEAIQAYVADQVASAPQLLERAALALDLAALDVAPSPTVLEDVLARLRYAGVCPVGLIAAPEGAIAPLARTLGLPLLPPERPRGRKASEPSSPQPPAPAASTPSADPPAPASPSAAPPTTAAQANTGAPPAPAQIYTGVVRSGQRIYARGRDLIVAGPVSMGAEVLADGNIHVYGRLSGRALAGAQGNTAARIFCTAFQAELVAIAGHYKLIESIGAQVAGKAAQVYLDGERLEIVPLSA